MTDAGYYVVTGSRETRPGETGYGVDWPDMSESSFKNLSLYECDRCFGDEFLIARSSDGIHIKCCQCAAIYALVIEGCQIPSPRQFGDRELIGFD